MHWSPDSRPLDQRQLDIDLTLLCQIDIWLTSIWGSLQILASFTKEDNLQLAKRPLKTNGHLANHGLTSLIKEATGS